MNTEKILYALDMAYKTAEFFYFKKHDITNALVTAHNAMSLYDKYEDELMYIPEAKRIYREVLNFSAQLYLKVHDTEGFLAIINKLSNSEP